MIVNKNRVSDTGSCESLVHIYIFSFETTQPNGSKLNKDDSWKEEITCCNEGCPHGDVMVGAQKMDIKKIIKIVLLRMSKRNAKFPASLCKQLHQ